MRMKPETRRRRYLESEANWLWLHTGRKFIVVNNKLVEVPQTNLNPRG